MIFDRVRIPKLVRGRTGLLAALALSVALIQPAAANAQQSGVADAPPQAQTQTSDGGQVTIKATWLGPEAGPVFAVVLDTHSVNLDAFDLARLAALRTDQGLEVQPIGWDAPAGGHHREGTLSFADVAPDGSSLLGPDVMALQLVIRDVAVPERVLQWSVH
jgi:hypothetical protein